MAGKTLTKWSSRHNTKSDISTDDSIDYYSDELKTESDDEAAVSVIPGQPTQVVKRRSRSKSSRGKSSSSRDESKKRDKSVTSRSERSGRSKSVSRDLRKSSKTADSGGEGTRSTRQSRRIKVSTDPAPTLVGSSGDQHSETQLITNRKSKTERIRDVSLTGIEISLDGRGGDDDSTGPLASLSKKKKTSSRRKSSKDKDDDETASRGSMGTLKKKKSSMKKADESGSAGSLLTSPTSSSITKKVTKTKKADDVIDRTITLKKQHRSSDAVKQINEHTQKPPSLWENEEYLLSPTPFGRRSVDDGSNSEWQKRRSNRSMMSDLSSQKRSTATAPTSLEGSFATDGSSLRDTMATLSKQLGSGNVEKADLKKSLALAFDTINSLNDNLRVQQEDSAKAKDELKDMLSEMRSVSKRNEKLRKNLDVAQNELSTKEGKLDYFQKLLEENLHRVEFLEDELFVMDEELKNNTMNAYSSAAAERATKIASIKSQRQKRMASNATAAGVAIGDLLPPGIDQSSQHQGSSCQKGWERELEEKEHRLELERARQEAREKNLDDRARALEEKERSLEAAESRDAAAQPCDDKDTLILDLKAECADLIAENEELAESALEDIREKQREIETLQKKLGVITEEFEERNARELLGKDATIRQLQEELLATRAVIEAKTSDQYSTEMKALIKSLGDQVSSLTKRLKSQQSTSKSAINEKELALDKVQREVTKLQSEVSRLKDAEKQRAAKVVKDSSDDSKHFIEELEDEIRHWKRVNLELEDELEHFKREADELTRKLEEDEDQDVDDNASMGSFTSHLSRQSRQSHSMRQSRSSIACQPNGGFNMSQPSLSSQSNGDLFFSPNSSAAVADNSSDVDQETSSLRAMRSVSSLWTKMTQKTPLAPGGLYQISLDD